MHKVLPCITLYYTACTRCFPVLLRTTTLAQALSSTTSYYKTCTQYFPVLLCTTALEALPPVPEHGGSGSCLLTLNSFNVYGIFMGLLNLMFGLYDLLFRGFDLLAVVLPRFAAWCNQIDASLHFSLDRPVSEGFYYLLFFFGFIAHFGSSLWFGGCVDAWHRFSGEPKKPLPARKVGPRRHRNIRSRHRNKRSMQTVLRTGPRCAMARLFGGQAWELAGQPPCWGSSLSLWA